MIVSVGGTLFMLLRLWQMKSMAVVLQSGNSGTKFYYRWWAALLISFAGIILLVIAFVMTGGGTSNNFSEFPLDDSELEVLTTQDGVEYVRTPDEYFEDLQDWPYEVKYVEIDGLRQAYYEAGPADGEVILLLHGQPAWSYLYRKMIPPLADAGYRVIAMDYVGMGRSDKPIDLEYYSYLGHVDRMEKFIYELELEHITAFVQDWGSLTGLNVIGNNTERFDRVVMGNGTLPRWEEGFVPYEIPEIDSKLGDMIYENISNAPEQQELYRDEDGNFLPGVKAGDDTFGYCVAFALNYEGFRVSDVLEADTYFPLSEEEERAYDAPFPARITMGGPRTFPSFVNEVPGTTETAWEGLRSFDKPFLTVIGNNDKLDMLGSVENQNYFIENVPGAKGQPHTRLKEASHFLQDSQGPEIARLMLEFMAANPID